MRTPGRNACIQGQLTFRILVFEINIIVREVALDIAFSNSDIAFLFRKRIIIRPKLRPQLLTVRIDVIK